MEGCSEADSGDEDNGNSEGEMESFGVDIEEEASRVDCVEVNGDDVVGDIDDANAKNSADINGEDLHSADGDEDIAIVDEVGDIDENIDENIVTSDEEYEEYEYDMDSRSFDSNYDESYDQYEYGDDEYEEEE